MAEDLLKKLLESPIDRKNPAVAPLLEDLQGNILKPHGRDYSVHVFLQFRSTPEALAKAKQWIEKFAKARVTSAKKQFEERDEFKKSRISGGLFANFFLTSQGYETLGIRPSPGDPRFVNGMKAYHLDLSDPDPKEWEEGYTQNIHAAILLADDDGSELSELNREADIVLQEVSEFATVLAVERGNVIRKESKGGRKKKGEPSEHFGYVDGRSQPLFLLEELKKEKREEPGQRKYKPSAPPRLVLVPDPNGAGEMSCGSYLVFRKLEQNVRGFRDAVKALAQQLKGDDRERRAAALVVGRSEAGTPVVLQEKEGLINLLQNNFDYSEDLLGDRCPLHAHIRQVNPRGPTEEEREHRIARRGIPYGEQCKEDLPTKDVGLLFMCFQSNIADQFEFIQREWANDKDLSRRKRGVDPVIGQSDDQVEAQDWPTSWGSRDRTSFSFTSFVRLKGGEYFFAPSISALTKVNQALRRLARTPEKNVSRRRARHG